MAKKIAVVNKKGGVGKTTTALNVAAFLSLTGKKVLAVDLDPQSNLTVSFGTNLENQYPHIGDVFLNRKQLNDIIINVGDNFNLAPARTDLATIIDSGEFAKHFKKNEILKTKMNGVNTEYDYIIFDTPTSVEGPLTMNALAVADYVIVPLQLDLYSAVGIRQVMDIIADVQNQYLNEQLRTLGLVITFYQTTLNCKKYLGILKDTKYGSWLFTNMIRRSTSLCTSVTNQLPIALYDSKSIGYVDYEALTREIVERVEEKVFF